jgi:hypothetical protein
MTNPGLKWTGEGFELWTTAKAGRLESGGSTRPRHTVGRGTKQLMSRVQKVRREH